MSRRLNVPRPDGQGPRTVTGRRLKALAVQDIQAARALPDDPSPECAQAVIDNAFFIAVRERFGDRPDPDHVQLLAQGINRLCRSIPTPDVEALILAEYADSASPEPSQAAEIKAMTFATIADDLSLYDHEIDDLIVMAESIAAEDGCELSLLRLEEDHEPEPQ